VDRSAGVTADGTDVVHVRVTVRDASGNPMIGATVQLAATGGGNTLTQPAAATNDSGIATGTLVSTVAEVKTFSATLDQGALPSTATTQFSAGPAVRLAFVQQPTDTEATVPIAPAVTVVALDRHGNTATWMGQVLLGVVAGSGPGNLSGTVSTAPVTSVATFTGLAVSAAGRYTLVAGSGALTSASSNAFDIRPLAVTGTRVAHWITDTGVVDRPEDLRQATLGAWVQRGTDFTWFPGTGAADGTFQIPGVPYGLPYFLCTRIDCFETTSRTVDLGFHLQGRPTITFASPGTFQRTALTGMAPWTDHPAFGVSDDLQMYSSNSGLWFDSLQYLSTGPALAAGTSSLAQTYDYSLFGASGFNPVLADAAAGDRTWFTQLTTRDVGFVNDHMGAPYRWNTYQAVERVFGPAPLTIADGATTDVTGAFTPVPQTKALALNWLIADGTPGSFGSYRTDVNDRVTPDLVSHLLAIDALPDSTHGFYGTAPDLAVMFLGDGPPAPQPDQRLSLVYGDPYPTSWGRFGIAITTFLVPYAVARGPNGGQTVPIFESGNIQVNDLLPSFPASALKPQVSPVTGATIDGAPFLSDQTFFGSTSHVIRWSPPAVGTPTFYTVWIRRFFADEAGGPVQRTTVARFTTTGTQVTVPPGFIEPGFQYSVRIVATVQPGHDVARAPFEQQWPYHAAATFSGLLFVPLTVP
jgi:hypothetical protein